MPDPESAAARHNMIDGQLRPHQVNNPALLHQFSQVSRHLFLPGEYRLTAYADAVTPLTPSRSLFAPLTLGRLLQALNPQPTDTALVVAGNTGYSSALLAPLVKHLSMTDDDASLLAVAKIRLAGLGNVTLAEASPLNGHPAHAPYSLILLDAAAETVPPALKNQLAEGGRLAAVIKGQNGLYTATLTTRHGNSYFTQELFETAPAPHPALQTDTTFVF